MCVPLWLSVKSLEYAKRSEPDLMACPTVTLSHAVLRTPLNQATWRRGFCGTMTGEGCEAIKPSHSSQWGAGRCLWTLNQHSSAWAFCALGRVGRCRSDQYSSYRYLPPYSFLPSEQPRIFRSFTDDFRLENCCNCSHGFMRRIQKNST